MQPISARASARPATHPDDQAHWKLKPPSRPSTSRISPTRCKPGQTPRLHRRRINLVERHAAGGDLGKACSRGCRGRPDGSRAAPARGGGDRRGSDAPWCVCDRARPPRSMRPPPRAGARAASDGVRTVPCGRATLLVEQPRIERLEGLSSGHTFDGPCVAGPDFERRGASAATCSARPGRWRRSASRAARPRADRPSPVGGLQRERDAVRHAGKPLMRSPRRTSGANAGVVFTYPCPSRPAISYPQPSLPVFGRDRPPVARTSRAHDTRGSIPWQRRSRPPSGARPGHARRSR